MKNLIEKINKKIGTNVKCIINDISKEKKVTINFYVIEFNKDKTDFTKTLLLSFDVNTAVKTMFITLNLKCDSIVLRTINELQQAIEKEYY